MQIELATAAALARDIGRPEPWAPVLQVDRRQVGALRMCSAQHAGGADYPLEPVAISLRLVPDSRDVRGFVRKRTDRTRQSIGPFVAPNACMRLRQRCQLRADLGRHKNRRRLRLSCIAGESPPGAKRPGCAVPIGARIAVDLRPSVSETGDDSPEAPILGLRKSPRRLRRGKGARSRSMRETTRSRRGQPAECMRGQRELPSRWRTCWPQAEEPTRRWLQGLADVNAWSGTSFSRPLHRRDGCAS
jgi:hypothetical protein